MSVQGLWRPLQDSLCHQGSTGPHQLNGNVTGRTVFLLNWSVVQHLCYGLLQSRVAPGRVMVNRKQKEREAGKSSPAAQMDLQLPSVRKSVHVLCEYTEVTTQPYPSLLSVVESEAASNQLVSELCESFCYKYPQSLSFRVGFPTELYT